MNWNRPPPGTGGKMDKEVDLIGTGLKVSYVGYCPKEWFSNGASRINRKERHKVEKVAVRRQTDVKDEIKGTKISLSTRRTLSCLQQQATK
jgi:hypothetical protein